MLLIMILVLAGLAEAGPSQLSQRINVFCQGRQSCVAQQKDALRKFLGITVMYDAPETQMKTCMKAGTVEELTDWTKAEGCIRNWSHGRQSVVKRSFNAPSKRQ